MQAKQRTLLRYLTALIGLGTMGLGLWLLPHEQAGVLPQLLGATVLLVGLLLVYWGAFGHGSGSAGPMYLGMGGTFAVLMVGGLENSQQVTGRTVVVSVVFSIGIVIVVAAMVSDRLLKRRRRDDVTHSGGGGGD